MREDGKVNTALEGVHLDLLGGNGINCFSIFGKFESLVGCKYPQCLFCKAF